MRLPLELETLLQDMSRKYASPYDPHEELPAVMTLLSRIEDRVKLSKEALVRKADEAKEAMEREVRSKVAAEQLEAAMQGGEGQFDAG